MSTIPVLKPSCTHAEIEAVRQVLESGWWGMGPKCEELEARLSQLSGFQHCVTVNSATAALHLALLALDVHQGDEVILPALTFVSTALAVKYVGATPIYADVDAETLCLDWRDVRRKVTRRTVAVIPVDYAGYPATVDQPKLFPIRIVEDAAHMPLGLHSGDIVCYSFHPVKPLACGDGGAILTNNRHVADELRSLRWCGIDRSTWQRSGKKYAWDYDIVDVGYKCHLNDIQAALVLAQLDRFDDLLCRRRELAQRYQRNLYGTPEIQLPASHMDHLWHLYTIRTAESKRDALLDYLAARGISAGVHYKPVTQYRPFKDTTPKVTDREWRRLISLPLYPDMTDAEQDRVIEAVYDFFHA